MDTEANNGIRSLILFGEQISCITVIWFWQIVHSLNLPKMYDIVALIQLPEFIIFSLKSVICWLQIFLKLKTGYIVIDFDVIFPMQSSEFIKALDFGSNLKKTTQFFIFHQKMDFCK